ncbi:PREDICTED: defensin-5-like [Dipodomys ordii]|uniref:Defensin-5-like n=1 Tax=Dipodomys ordii TaxID=10020 RepID=A0A1S3FSX8_DIPOR|nr:PREDICTED: defensin-5-like [Dipodomys ordii]
MRTLALLAALLLLAVQAHSATLPEPAEEVPNQNQPEDGDEEMAKTFSGAGNSTLPDADCQGRQEVDGAELEPVLEMTERCSISHVGPSAPRLQAGRYCYCRIGDCQDREHSLGTCIYGKQIYRFCC